VNSNFSFYSSGMGELIYVSIILPLGAKGDKFYAIEKGYLEVIFYFRPNYFAWKYMGQNSEVPKCYIYLMKKC
jgi:hypothetical protein